MDIVRQTGGESRECLDRRLYFDGPVPESNRGVLGEAIGVMCTLTCCNKVEHEVLSGGGTEVRVISTCGTVQRLLELQGLGEQ